jgi:hypothetical protein
MSFGTCFKGQARCVPAFLSRGPIGPDQLSVQRFVAALETIIPVGG